MVVYNYSGKEINAKIVYYGPALSGKTTNLEWIYSKIPVEYSGKMVSLRTQADRTIFFDFLPLDLGMIDGFRTRFMLYTVPGQVHYNATRKMVLKGVDGLVFVADSDPSRMQDNLDSLQNLRDNLQELGLNPDSLPLVLQWNKRDLPNCMPVSELERELNVRALPSFEACSLTGEGVYETLHKASRLIYSKLTGDQLGSGGAEDASLFGDNIAQCLQDVDHPQPEPERVAVAAGNFSPGAERGAADALGAILGGSFGSDPEATADGGFDNRSANDTSQASMGQVESPMPEHGEAARQTTVSHDARHPSSEPWQSDYVDGGDMNDHKSGPHNSGPIPGAAESSDLGGLVDEVLNSLKDAPDLASVDRSASRPQAQFEPHGPTSAPTDVIDQVSDKLDAFFDEAATRPIPSVSPQPQSPPSAEASQGNPAQPVDPVPGSGIEIEHDTDIFDELNSGAVDTSALSQGPASSGSLNIEAMLENEREQESGDLGFITDPLKLRSESRPVAPVSSLTGSSSVSAATISRVLEVPVTLDASTLEQGGTIRIVLNVSVKS